jgi:hypothetical protein
MKTLSFLRNRPVRSRVLHVGGSALVPALRGRHRPGLL